MDHGKTCGATESMMGAAGPKSSRDAVDTRSGYGAWMVERGDGPVALSIGEIMYRLLVLLLLAAAPLGAGEEEVRAGEMFSGAKGWLNTKDPLTNDMLKG